MSASGEVAAERSALRTELASALTAIKIQKLQDMEKEG
jgi:hypothetical protein